MGVEIEDGEADYFWKGSGLFSCSIDSVVFGEANVTRDPDQGNLRPD